MHAYSQDLHIALRKVLAKVTDANNSSLPLDSPDHETALTVEYSDVHGNLQPVIMEGDQRSLSQLRSELAHAMRLTGCETLADIGYEAIYAPLFDEF